MPRGRQKRVSAGRRYTPTTSSRRSRDRNGPDDAACVTAVTAVDDVNNGAMNRRATSGAPTHPRWDVASPANWSASLLRQTIEDRGMKLPSGIKKIPTAADFPRQLRHSIRPRAQRRGASPHVFVVPCDVATCSTGNWCNNPSGYTGAVHSLGHCS